VPCLFFVQDEAGVHTMQKLRLTGCARYNYKGELYLKGKVYSVGDNKATNMLRDEDAFGRPYFVPYVKPAKSKTQRIAEAAAAAAAKAAQEEAEIVIERPDGSEPDPTEDKVVAPDPEEVSEEELADEHDEDDLDLDGEDEDNSEEVDDDEDEDRDDGSAVEV